MESNKIKIMEESDYRKFKTLNGNRPVDTRVKRIAEAIKESGIQVPIVVNERMEVIDGQHRLEAMKLLGQPVSYYVVPGLGIDACMNINKLQKNWGVTDFVHGYAENGNTSYSYFEQLLKQYRSFTNIAIYVAATGRYGGRSTKALKSGDMEIGEKDYNLAREFLDFVSPVKEYFYGNGRLDHWIYVLRVCYLSDKVRNDRLIEAIKRYRLDIAPILRLDQAADIIDGMYNKCLDKKRRVDIVHLVRKHRAEGWK